MSTGAFSAEQRRVDDLLSRLTHDIADERANREKGDVDQQKALDKLIANQRWLVAAVILPIALFLASIYLTRSGQ